MLGAKLQHNGLAFVRRGNQQSNEQQLLTRPNETLVSGQVNVYLQIKD